MSDVTVNACPPQGMITLRGDLAVLGKAVKSIAGCTLPDLRMSTTSGDCTLLWMSPDELLLVTTYHAAPELAAKLSAELAKDHATVAVVSDARAVFDIGAGGEDVLSQLAPVDFAAMAPTEVRRTRMAQVPAAFWRHGDGWRVVCFRSVADYVEGLLLNATA